MMSAWRPLRCKSHERILRFALVVFGLTACEQQTRESPPEATPVESRPAQLTADDGSIWKLVTPPADFPVQFTTYVPAKVRSSFTADSSGATASFYWGEPRSIESPFLHVFFMPAGEPIAKARSLLTSYLEGRNAYRDNLVPTDGWPWAESAYLLDYRGNSNIPFGGWAFVDTHAGRAFYLIAHYPGTAAPPIRQSLLDVLERWEWEGGVDLTSVATP